jgi:antitoxin component of MazEF toxin-antitoxin module
MHTTLRQWGNSVGVRIPKEALHNCNLQLNDELEIITFNGGFTLQKKPRKTFSDIAKPLVSTKGWKFDRDEANERR